MPEEGSALLRQLMARRHVWTQIADLEHRVERVEQERDELRQWVAGLERRQAFLDERIVAAELRVEVLLTAHRGE